MVFDLSDGNSVILPENSSTLFENRTIIPNLIDLWRLRLRPPRSRILRIVTVSKAISNPDLPIQYAFMML